MPQNDPLTRAPNASGILPELPHGSEVLLIRLRSLGDLVIETAVIRALHDWQPDLRIVVLAEQRFAAVFEGNPAVTEILLSRGLAETAREIRRRDFPVVFNQHGGPRSAMLTGASRAKWRIGWQGFQYSFLYNVKVPDAQEFFGGAPFHTVDHRASQLYFAGLPRGPIPAAQLFPQPDAVTAAATALKEQGIGADQPYAVLQPGARTEVMRWPLEKFAELAKWLRATHGIASVVNLAARDEELASAARTAFEGIAIIPRALDVRELIALTARASLFVGNDSGPAHVASALDRPTVALFSETDPVQWGPRNAKGRAVSTGAAFTHPRGDKAVLASQSRPTKPMSAISIEEVQAACDDVLRSDIHA